MREPRRRHGQPEIGNPNCQTPYISTCFSCLLLQPLHVYTVWYCTLNPKETTRPAGDWKPYSPESLHVAASIYPYICMRRLKITLPNQPWINTYRYRQGAMLAFSEVYFIQRAEIKRSINQWMRVTFDGQHIVREWQKLISPTNVNRLPTLSSNW